VSEIELVELAEGAFAETRDSFFELIETVRSLATTKACVGGLQVDNQQSGVLYVRRQGGVDAAGLFADSRWYLNLETVPGWGWWQREDSIDSAGMHMTVLAMRFPDEKSRSRFIDATREHGEYCWENESDTQVYGLSVVVDAKGAANQVALGDLVVVMICTDALAFEKHRDDPRHLALGDKIAALSIPVESSFAQTYELSAAGYLWR